MSVRENVARFFEKSYTDLHTRKITMGYISPKKGIRNVNINKPDFANYANIIRGAYEEKNGSLVHKLNGVKIIGVKAFDGTYYSDKPREIPVVKDEPKEKIEIKPVETKKAKSRPTKTMIDDLGFVYLDDKPIKKSDKGEK